MWLSKISQTFNSLTTQIFGLFWLTFLILLSLSFFLPNLDARTYRKIEGRELHLYQNIVISNIDDSIELLLNTDKPLANGLKDTQSEKTNSSNVPPKPHPILVDQQRNILGATEAELKPLQKFISHSDNPNNPLKRRFNNIQIVGPFLISVNQYPPQFYTLYLVEKVDPQQEIINFIFDNPLIMLMLIMLISSPFLLWLAWSITKPVRELRFAANAVAQGNFTINKKLEENGVSELRLVGRSFNQMTQSLEELLSNQQTLLSSISHELRTPLTRLRLAAALLRRTSGDSKELDRIETETERLDNMINDLLLLSRQQLNSHISREIFEINNIWEEIFEDAQFEAEQRNLQFDIIQKITSPQKYLMNGNHPLITSAVENILRNALKYTNSKIEATVFLNKKQLCIHIDDDGPGVPENEYTQIFKPFYRVDSARTRETGGTGLGLAIVANVAHQHHGEVFASKSHLGGLRITIKLPLWIA